jgi:hypothetical protein
VGSIFLLSLQGKNPVHFFGTSVRDFEMKKILQQTLGFAVAGLLLMGGTLLAQHAAQGASAFDLVLAFNSQQGNVKAKGSATTKAKPYTVRPVSGSDRPMGGADTPPADSPDLPGTNAANDNGSSGRGNNSHLLLEEESRVFPNPTHGKVTVEVDVDPERGPNVGVFNTLGQQVVVSIIRRGKGFEFDLTGFPPGIYFVKVTIGDKTIIHRISLR